MSPSRTNKICTLLGSGVAILMFQAAIAAPTIDNVSGSLEHGSSIEITGTGFGSATPERTQVWDAVENQPDLMALPDDSVIPTDYGPWTHNGNPWSTPVRIEKESQGRHSNSKAHHRGVTKSYLGWPANFKDNANRSIYVSWWFKPYGDIDAQGGANKLIRIWDDPNGKHTRISWTQELLGGYGGDASWKGWQGTAHQWNRLEIYVNSDAGTITTWTNGKIVHHVTDFVKADYDGGLTIGLVGFDPNYNDRYEGLRFDFDDIYASESLARVEISDQSEWDSAGNRKELQIPRLWSNDKLELTVNLGQFDASQGLYLYVVNDNGEVNQQGYQICSKCPSTPEMGIE
ncbi:hypothetical protein ACQUWM_02590 [Marinobacter sp. DUT-3]|uniref:hypothetical protein n=1 Tax=Marinobacter sp. DUT-3 TaxID=3412036 RepID=UPI003D186BD4